MPARQINIVPPLGGVDLSTAVQSQPPYTTPAALNYFPRDVFQRRRRGGSRPGLAMFAKGAAAVPVRMAASMYVNPLDDRSIWTESFAFDSMSHYATMTNADADEVPGVDDGTAYVTDVGGSFVFKNSTPAAGKRRFGVYIVPYQGAHVGGTYVLAMESADLNVAYSFRFTINADGKWSLESYNGTTLDDDDEGDDGESLEGWLEVEIDESDDAVLYWRGTALMTLSITSSTRSAAVAMVPAEDAENRMQIRRAYYWHKVSAANNLQRPFLFVSAGGSFDYHDFIGPLVRNNAYRTLASDHYLSTAEFGGYLFIADWSEPIAFGTDGSLGSGTFDSASYSNWTTVFSGKKFQDYVLTIDACPATPTVVGTYPLTAVASGNLSITGGASATNCTWRILRCPKYCRVNALTETPLASGSDGAISSNSFDSASYSNWTTVFAGKTDTDYVVQILNASTKVVEGEYSIVSHNSGAVTTTGATNGTGLTFRIVPKDRLTEWRATTAGTLPVGCRGVASYLGCLVLYGDPLAENEVYFTAISDPFDVEFGDAIGDATKMSASNLAAKLRGGVTAFVPYADSYALISTRTAVFRLSGLPNQNGSLSEINPDAGFLTSTSWCYGVRKSPEGVEKTGLVFALTNQGMMMTQVDCPTCELVQVSRDKLPQEFLRFTPELTQFSLQHDPDLRGVHIWITPQAASTSVMHWFFDLETGGFFPVRYADKGLSPTCAIYYSGLSLDDQCVLIGTFDGDILRYSWTAENDCGEAIESYVLIGPLRLSKQGNGWGRLDALYAAVPSLSGDVDYELYGGDTAEEALIAAEAGASPDWAGTFANGCTTRDAERPLLGAAFVVLKLKGVDRPWTYESLVADVVELGALR